MQIGYMRVSKADGSQSTDLQRDALRAVGVTTRRLYEDRASGRLDARPGLDAALKALRRGDTLIVWKLDRLGRDLRHLINVVHDLSTRSIGFKVLTGHGASIDTTTPSGKLVFGIFAALAEFERDLISERTKAAAKVLQDFFGSDEVTADVMYPPIFGMTRHWHSFSEISKETNNARVWGGIHTRHACTDGAELGRQVAEYCLANYMKPVN